MPRRPAPVRWLALAALAGLASSAPAQHTAEIELLNGAVIDGDPASVISLAPERPAVDPLHGLRLFSQATGEGSAGRTLDQVLQIRWRPTESFTITSGPQTQCVSLGSDLTSSLPTDWASEGSSLRWQAAQAPRIFHQWRHIPGAQWIWPEAGWFNADHQERAVFRHDFQLPENLRIVEASLLVGVDDALAAGKLNGVDLPLPADTHGEMRWDVTEAVRPGANHLGLVAVDRPPANVPIQNALINAAGLAFRLEIRVVPDMAPPESLPSCIARLINGDRITGQLRSIDDSEINLGTVAGNLSIDRDWVTELLVSAGPVPSGFSLFSREPPPASPIVYALPRQIPSWAPGLLLADGTHLSGRVLRTERQGVVVKPRYSDAWMVNCEEIRAVFVNGTPEEGYFHYDPASGARICRVTTVAGDHFSGLLTDLDNQVELNLPEMASIRLRPEQIVEATFPMSSRLWARRALAPVSTAPERRIEVWGQVHDAGDDTPYRENLAAQVNQIASDLGFPLRWIDDMRLASGQIRADTTPALFLIDDREEFPFTVRKRGDGLESLRFYANSGGAVILIPAGIPFYYGREWTGQRWDTRPLRLTIPSAFGFTYLAPGEWRPDARAFELPENQGETLVFERIAQSAPWDLLPARLIFPSLDDARFRPILPFEGDPSVTVSPIYRLVSDAGEHFGIAMAAIGHTHGDLAGSRFYHIAPALARAVDETGEPALHRILPAVLMDALVPSQTTSTPQIEISVARKP
jgi:hypothetical protein